MNGHNKTSENRGYIFARHQTLVHETDAQQSDKNLDILLVTGMNKNPVSSFVCFCRRIVAAILTTF
jgi:hypothetical protein